MAVRRSRIASVFLNIPYDPPFERLYLAYVVGLTIFRVRVECTLGLSDTGRLDRIFQLIEARDASVHDLSRVELSGGLPRFNMPIELGIALHHERQARGRHRAYVFERRKYRLHRTASDLNLLDPQIHRGSAKGVMQGLRNIFREQDNFMTVPEMLRILRVVRRRLPALMRDAGGGSVYRADVFKDLAAATMSELEKTGRLQARGL